MADYTYVENVAHAFICAEAALGSRMLIVSGKVFFITNLEPVSSWDFSLRILEGLGYYSTMVRFPEVVFRLIIYLIKWMHSKTNSRNINNSVSVHNIVRLMSHSTTYDCSAARQHIEYSPIVSLDEGITSTIGSFSHLSKGLSSIVSGGLNEHSRMEQLLGGGEVEEILLWSDERKSFLCFGGVVSVFYWFCLCGRTVVSSIAQLMLLTMIFLYGYVRLPDGSSLWSSEESTSTFRFEVSEMAVKKCARSIAKIWNGVSDVSKSLARGKDWTLFFKVVVSFHLFKKFIINMFPMSLGIVLVFSFIFCLVYEQYEEEIEGLAGFLYELTRHCVMSCVLLLIKPLLDLLYQKM